MIRLTLRNAEVLQKRADKFREPLGIEKAFRRGSMDADLERAGAWIVNVHPILRPIGGESVGRHIVGQPETRGGMEVVEERNSHGNELQLGDRGLVEKHAELVLAGLRGSI